MNSSLQALPDSTLRVIPTCLPSVPTLLCASEGSPPTQQSGYCEEALLRSSDVCVLLPPDYPPD